MSLSCCLIVAVSADLDCSPSFSMFGKCVCKALNRSGSDKIVLIESELRDVDKSTFCFDPKKI